MAQITLADYEVFQDPPVELDGALNQLETFYKDLPADVVTTGHAVVSWRDRCKTSGSKITYEVKLNGNVVMTGVTAEVSRSYTRHEAILSSTLNAGGQNQIWVHVQPNPNVDPSTKLEISDMVLSFKRRIEV